MQEEIEKAFRAGFWLCFGPMKEDIENDQENKELIERGLEQGLEKYINGNLEPA